MAGRIPQHFIDELLDRVDIVDVIDSRVKLKKSGRNFMACCPFHDEKSPSFSVQPEKQFYYCFGCGAGGNALGFLMEYERLDFRPAIEQLASKCGLQIPEESREDQAVGDKKRGLYDVLERADLFYREQLRSHTAAKPAIEYLKSRGLSGAIAQRFGIGFAPPGWDNLLKVFETERREAQGLLDAGLLVHRDAGGGRQKIYDRFRHRIIFPIRDSRGRTIAFGGRVMGDDKPKYLNSPETTVFKKARELYGLYEAREANKHLQRLIIVEGYMDVIALAQHGIQYAVATLGTATNEHHLQRLFRHCSELIYCFDGDAAGANAARRALDVSLTVMEDGRQLKFLFLPAGEDPDSLVRQEGAEKFEQRVDNAQPLSDYLFESAGKGFNLASADGKAAMSSRALAMISKLPSGAFKQILHSELGSRTGLADSAIQSLVAVEAEHAAPQALAQTPPETLPQTRPQARSQSNPRAGEAGAPPELGDMGEEPGYFIDDDSYVPADVESFEEMPRGRPLREAKVQRLTESLSIIETAISLLVYKPSLANLVGDVEDLGQSDDSDMKLFLQIVELLNKRPESSTGMLIGYWYGQPEGERLTELCGRGIELLREGLDALEREGQQDTPFEDGLELRFSDTLSRLRGQLEQHRYDDIARQLEWHQSRGEAAPAELIAQWREALRKKAGR